MKISSEEYKELVVIEERYYSLMSYLMDLTKKHAYETAYKTYSNKLEDALKLEVDLKEIDRAMRMNLSKCAEQTYNRTIKDKEVKDDEN